MLLRSIKEVRELLLKLVGVDRIIIGVLLASSRVRVVWPLLRLAKEKRHGRPIGAVLP